MTEPREHELTNDCWCEPTVYPVGIGHNAMGGETHVLNDPGVQVVAAERASTLRTYRVKTASGDDFVWTGELPAAGENNVVTIGCAYPVLLKCPSGTLVNLAHVESMTPVD